MNRRTIRGVVFDMDGVLISSSDCHRRAFEQVLGAFSITGFQYERYAGWRTPDVFRDVFREAGVAAGEETVAESARAKSALAREWIAAAAPVAADCDSVLTALARRYRLALASSGSRASVEAFLDLSGLRTVFHSVLTGDDVTRAKPDPEIFSRSFAALGLPPEACVVVEDAVAGIEAARAAGARAIGYGLGRTAELEAAGADAVAGSLAELPALLERLAS
jgi:HAD superfamily hydrolase (TIGR01509 family)